MKKKFLFFSVGVVSILSCAAALNFAPRERNAKADGVVDVGDINFRLEASGVTTKTGIYLLGDKPNEVPVLDEWRTRFRSTEANAVVVNGDDLYTKYGIQVGIAKFYEDLDEGIYKYYVAIGDEGFGFRTEGDVVTIKGNFTTTVNDVTYSLYINEASFTWTKNHWVQNFIVPELETYDKISLPQIAADDFDQVAINTETDTCGWNSWTPSANNTTNSFAFEFAYESYSKLDKTFILRFGGFGPWDSEHCFKMCLNNTWGPTGVIIYDEVHQVDGKSIIAHASNDIPCSLLPGARHIIECASIVVKNSEQVYNYVKFDGEYLYQDVFTPITLERTTRIGMHYDSTNIFVGGTTEQKENVDVMTFNHDNGVEGIYLFGPENDIPVLSSWNSKGAPASKFNMLKNGEKMYEFDATSEMPLRKIQSDEYYIGFSDYDLTFKVGDSITVGGEFHFYVENKAYTMAIVPFVVEWDGDGFVFECDLDNYLVNKINNYVSLDCFEGDNIALVTAAIQNAQTSIRNASGMKAKWDAYYQGTLNICEIPMIESKLDEYKLAAIEQLNNLVDEDKYEDIQLEVINGYIEAGIANINAATNVKQIMDIVEAVKAQIASVATRQDLIEAKILALEEGYEQYLSKNDVITTTDLGATGALVFRSINSEEESYGTGSDENGINARFPVSSDNEEGNVIMQFNYRSNNPLSNKHGSQIFIRVRGDGSNCYIFHIARNLNGGAGVTMGRFIDNALEGEKHYDANFAADTNYKIECGAIDLDGYDRTFLFVKINNSFVLKDIVDKVSTAINPTVIFMDSHTADGSDDYASLSPVEEGTTKVDNSQFLGRPILNNNSNADSLTATLRKNNVPSGANLYPAEENAFTYNGEELHEMHNNARIIKNSDTSYAISLSGFQLKDGDVIHVGGCFTYFDVDSCVKTVYKLSNTSFTYHASTNNWTQAAPSLEDAKAEAIDYINNYVDLNNYSEDNKTRIQTIIDTVVAQINGATTNEQVEQYLNNGLEQLDAIPTLLTEYKNNAQAELASYKSEGLYRDAEKQQLRSILEDAYRRINACNDTDSVDYIVLTTKQQIDQLKTAAEYDAEELASYKKIAKTEIETYIGLVEIERYSDENAAKIQQLALKARSDVDNATSKEQIDQIVNQLKEDIKNVPTNDGSTFDGEKYVEKGQGGKKGCGGSVIASSVIISTVTLIALVLLILKKKSILLNK